MRRSLVGLRQADRFGCFLKESEKSFLEFFCRSLASRRSSVAVNDVMSFCVAVHLEFLDFMSFCVAASLNRLFLHDCRMVTACTIVAYTVRIACCRFSLNSRLMLTGLNRRFIRWNRLAMSFFVGYSVSGGLVTA